MSRTLDKLPDVELHRVLIDAQELRDSELWGHIKTVMLAPALDEVQRTLEDRSIGGEQLKFAQGELKATREAKMLVERFIERIDVERRRRDRSSERKGSI